MASGGVISPDGRWLFYSSRLGPLGVRRGDCHLRAVRLDGSDDRLVADPAPCAGQRLFAHDGTRLAVQISPASALIVDASGQREPRLLEYSGTPTQSGALVRWMADDTKLVVVAATSVFFIDVATGESEEIYADDGAARIEVRAATDTHMVILRVLRRRTERGRLAISYHQMLVDARNGEITGFLDDCAGRSGVVVSVDGSAIVHVGCTEPFNEPDPEVWVRDLESGAERLLARLHTGVRLLRPTDHSGSILLASARGYFVVEEDGTVQPIDFMVSGGLGPARGWSWRGWVGDRGALLWDRAGRRPNRRHRLAYYDLDAGEGRIIVESECGRC